MSQAEFELAPGITEVVDLDRWALPLLEELAAQTRDSEIVYLAGKVALRLKGIDIEDN